MRTRFATTVALGSVACVTFLACTASPAPPDGSRPPSPTPSASPTPEPVATEPRVPGEPTTVLDAADAAARSVAASEALFAGAPVALLAAADDVAAQLSAAAAAVALGVPVLVDGPGVEDELERLGVEAVVTVGEVAEPDRPDRPDGPDVERHELPADPAARAAVLGVEPLATPTPEPGGDVAAVAGLTAGAGTSDPEDAEALPPVERGDAPDGGLVLTTGDVADLAAVATARAAGVPVVVVPGGDPRAGSATVQAVAAAEPASVVALGGAFGTADDLGWRWQTAATGVELPGGGQTLFPGRRLVALYGTPTFPALGTLGETDLGASIGRAQGLAAEYQALTADVVVPAFEIIVTIASAGAGPDGNYSNELPVETFVPWVEAARDAGVYVVIDLQPGRTDFLTQAVAYEPLLRYPNVGLALDPEWRLAPDQVHLRQIGSVGAGEVNAVSAWLAQLVRDQRLPQKLFVLHQFSHRMITDRALVDTSHPELATMIHVDGQGSQGAKAGTWASLQQGAPAGVTWGWKNFYDEDLPMLTPAETYGVVPLPELVTYQ